MKRRKNSDLSARKAEVVRLVIAGYSQREIGSRLGICQQRVSQEIAAAKEEFKKERLVETEEMRDKVLAEVASLKVMATEGYLRSVGDSVTTTREKSLPKLGGLSKSAKSGHLKRIAQAFKKMVEVKEIEKTEQLNGDPRYLQVIEWCINQECELYGLTEKAAVVNQNVMVNVEVSEEQRAKIQEGLMRRYGMVNQILNGEVVQNGGAKDGDIGT